MAKPFLSILLRGYTIAIITPMSQALAYGRVRAPGPTPSAQKSGNRMFMLQVKTLLARDSH